MQPLTRAVVVEPASPHALLPLLETRPFGLLPVGAQTLVGRLLTQLAATGVSEVDLLLRHLPEQTRAVVGDGARWGLTLRCHDVSSSPAETSLQALAESCLAGRGIAVGMEAMFDTNALKQWADQAESGHTLVTDDSGNRVLLCVLGDSFAQRKQAPCGSVRCIDTPADLWAENADALRSHGTTLHIERSLGDECYAGAGSRIAKDARIAGPALLGAGVAIASQADVGPNVIVGADVVIDEAAQVSDSLILSGTYIGPHTTVRGKIVDAGKVLDIRTQTVARIDDPTIVGSTRIATSDGSLWTVAGSLLVALGTLGYNSLFLASRSAQAILGNALLRTCNILLAAGAILFVAPLTLLVSVLRQPRSRVLKVYARRGERIEYRVTRLFHRGHPLWCMNYAPVLWHVLSGRIALTGPRLSSIAGGIPIYAHAPVAPGLLSPSMLQKRTGFARQKRQFADAGFVTQASLKSHFLLAARFMLSLVLGATPRSMPPQVELMRVSIANLSMNQALRRIAQMCTSKGLKQVAFVNADCLNISSYDTEYRAMLRRTPLVLADGIGVRQALKWFHRIGLRDNVNGTDLFPRLCRQAALHGWRVYFLGGRPGIAAKAAANAQSRFWRLTVAGTRDGYLAEADTKQVIADINASGADILLVAMGAPRQDLWIAHHAGELRVRVAMGVGGLFDFYSGTIPRAPQWMREVGLEWIYRLMQEPGRMWRRYLIGNPLFIWRAWRSSRRRWQQLRPGRMPLQNPDEYRYRLMKEISLAPKAANSTFWSIVQNGGKHVIALVIFVVMARLLDPDAYGSIALAGVVVTLVNVLVEQGFNDALVQRGNLESGHLNAAFWVTLGSAVLLAGALLSMAPLIASVLDLPSLTPVMRWLAVLFPLQALAIVPQALLQRAFAFRTLTLRTLAALTVGGAAGIFCALGGYGVWSLVIQQVVGSVTGLAVIWAGSAWRPGGAFERRHVLELYRFGRHIIGFNLIDFLKRKSDDLIIGFFLGPVALGVYSLGYQMLLMMEQLMCKGFDAVALSAFSRMQGNQAALRDAFTTVGGLSALVAFPAFLGAGLLIPELVVGILGEKWRSAVPVTQILLMVGALHSVFHYNHAVFKACGRPELSSRFGIIEAIANVALFLLIVRYGIEAMALTYVLVAYAMAPFSILAVRDLLGLDLKNYLRQFLAPLGASALMAASVISAQALLATHVESPALVAILIVTGILVYVASLRLIAPSRTSNVMAQVRLALCASPAKA